MREFLYSIPIAFSFFTTIPMPAVEWTERRLKFLPVLMPWIGLFIGVLGYGLYELLINVDFSYFSASVIMVLFYLVITGGLHVDGLMDTADAYFSRQSKEEKLMIMKDSRVGAFAIMTFVGLILLKTAFFYEIFRAGEETALVLLFIPVLSRIIQAFTLCSFPYAKKDGLAVIFGKVSGLKTTTMLILYFSLATVLIFVQFGLKSLFIPVSLLLFIIFYYFFSQKNFEGITGDIVGASVELTETLMLALVLVI